MSKIGPQKAGDLVPSGMGRPSLVLVLAVLAGCGRSEPSPATAASAATPADGSSWVAEPALEAKLGPERPILGGRFTVREPSGYTFQDSPLAAEFMRGETGIGFQLSKGVSARVTLDDFTKTTRNMEGLIDGKKDVRLGEVESGTAGGLPFRRFRYTFADVGGAKMSGVGYLTGGDAPDRFFLYIAAKAPADEIGQLEASVLSLRRAKD